MIIRVLIFILFTIGSLSSYAVETPQCFMNPKGAYDYLVNQEISAQRVKDNKPLNINQANEAELTALLGIGSHKANAIIEYRDRFGKFISVDALANVSGIGFKTVNKNRHRLRVD